MKDDQGFVVRVGLGVAILSFLLNPLIQLGQALGYKLSSGQELVLFMVTGAGFLLGVLIIISGFGWRRLFRNLQWPIVVRSPRRSEPKPEAEVPMMAVVGRPVGRPFPASPVLPSPAGTVNWPPQVSKLEHEIVDKDSELSVWGLDKSARKCLQRATDQFPNLSWMFLKDLAGLLHAAYVKPKTTFEVEFKKSDLREGYGVVGLPDIKRSLELPYEEADRYAKLFEKMIEDVQNESINDARHEKERNS